MATIFGIRLLEMLRLFHTKRNGKKFYRVKNCDERIVFQRDNKKIKIGYWN